MHHDNNNTPQPISAPAPDVASGESIAGKIDATRQDIYWRQNHMLQGYAYGRPYEDFRPAYQIGYEGFGEYGPAGKTFEESEAELRARYEKQNAMLPWEEAKLAARSAWNRLIEAESSRADEQHTVISVRFDGVEDSQTEAVS